MTDRENDFSAFMILDPLHYEALEIARSTLADAQMLHADSLFEDTPGKNSVLYSCFNPARAAGDAYIKGNGIISIVDSNFISGLRRVLEKEPGTALDRETKEIISFLVISAMCDGAITPGMAFLEMKSNIYGLPHLVESYNAFEFLCADVDLDLLSSVLVHDEIPVWELNKPITSPIPQDITTKISNLTGLTRYKSELYSTILAAIVEIKYDKSLTSSQKFEIFIKRVHSSGAFAMGSLRYFAIYFSEKPSSIGVKRKNMLKSIHSDDRGNVKRAVLNAASDCYFTSEYSSSINSFRERLSPRVFVTSDKALKFIMSSEFDDRSLWSKGISYMLDDFRGEKMSKEIANLLDEAIPMFDVDSVPKIRPPLRPSAKKFLDQQDEAIAAAWVELMDLVKP